MSARGALLAGCLALAPWQALAEEKPAPDPACARFQEVWGVEADRPPGAQFCDCIAQEIKRLEGVHADMPVLKAAEAFAALAPKAADRIEQGFADADPAATLSLAGYGYAVYEAAAQTCAPPEAASSEDGAGPDAEENGFEPPEDAPKAPAPVKPPKP